MIWDRLKYFKKTENWGDPNRVSGLLLLTMDSIRDIVNTPIHINSAYRENDKSPNGNLSQHALGTACDFYIFNLPFELACEKLLNSLNVLQIIDRVGLGAYPCWNTKGFHLDIRGTRARWGCIGEEYVGFDEAIKYYYAHNKKSNS